MADSDAGSRIDQALVARVLLGDDRRAFEQLVRRHQGMVRAQLGRLCHGDMAAADDIAQETFLLVWRKLDQFRQQAKFSTWVYRVAYTCFLQSRRKSSVVDPDASDAAMEHAQAPAHDLDLRLDLARAMRHLSAPEQAVLVHCVQMGLSHDEAAYVLDLPLGTVKTHVLRGKARLREHLAAWRPNESEESSP
ncbi:sigma-70 family RNA polymerase sigma factor [Bacillus sp. NP157]|nr:sigma-70 family RNA polymerase sigma factor [Bacillus sp. NP157]